MLKLKIVISFFLFSNFSALSQAKYLVYFTDKNNSTFSINKPEAFLTQKSILRRQKQHIDIKIADLPVNSSYVDSLKKLGVEIWYTSRWFNAAYVGIEDTANINLSIRNLGFVKKMQMLKPLAKGERLSAEKTRKASSNKYFIESNEYGESLNQVSQICADEMHNEGFKGDSITIAVLDGGFSNANQLYFFDSLFLQKRILGTYDFVAKTSNVYAYSGHGTNVLSCIAGYAKGKLIGTGFKSNFYLFRTEDGESEYPVEEANWLIAAEKADSLGVDIINSSLGYTTFDDPNLNNTYKDRDGKKPISSIAATMAARTGMICVISAGNEGRSKSDPYTASPGDADSVLTVGSVDKDGNLSEFSSFGPTIDGRMKPEVVAKGGSTTVGSPNGTIGTGSGTSYATPVLAGMVAGLWQSLPGLTNMEIIELVKKSGKLYNTPDKKLGYGIPCFSKARLLGLGKTDMVYNDINIIPNPFSNENLLLVMNPNDTGKTYHLEIYDISAKTIFNQIIESAEISNTLNITSGSLSSGLYFCRITSPDNSRLIRIIKI